MFSSLLYINANKDILSAGIITFYFQLIYENTGNIFKDFCQSGDNFSDKHTFVSNVEETNDNYKIIFSTIKMLTSSQHI